MLKLNSTEDGLWMLLAMFSAGDDATVFGLACAARDLLDGFAGAVAFLLGPASTAFCAGAAVLLATRWASVFDGASDSGASADFCDLIGVLCVSSVSRLGFSIFAVNLSSTYSVLGLAKVWSAACSRESVLTCAAGVLTSTALACPLAVVVWNWATMVVF